MSWSRFDDNWTRKIQGLGVSFPARWHYMSMIQMCSATSAYDGEMIPSAARTCSDVEDPRPRNRRTSPRAGDHHCLVKA